MRVYLPSLALAFAVGSMAPVGATPTIDSTLSDTLRITAGGHVTRKKLYETQEDKGERSISVDSSRQLISFVHSVGDVSDQVNFQAIHAILRSDTENGFASLKRDGSSVFNLPDEDVGIEAIFSSDINGLTSDTITYQLTRSHKPPKIIMSCVFDEVMFGEDDVCKLPEVTVDFAERDGTSDLLTVDAVTIGVLSDKSGLKRFDEVVVGELGTLFRVRAVSEVPEPNVPAMLGVAFVTLGCLRRRLVRRRSATPLD